MILHERVSFKRARHLGKTKQAIAYSLIIHTYICSSLADDQTIPKVELLGHDSGDLLTSSTAHARRTKYIFFDLLSDLFA